jgi:hypothetical protein
MYLMNNTVIGDHWGLFICIDVGYLGSYHYVIILCTLDLHKNWCHFCVHEVEYFECLLGYLGYMGEVMFIMHQLSGHELGLDVEMQW